MRILYRPLFSAAVIMKLSIALLGYTVTVNALSTGAAPKQKKHKAINPKDFVYVDGLRLKDAKGLHYITV